ncbi:MAG: ABC transporter permease [Gemmatimonadaceae bacterium]|nr:ABC transporter permease [Gemmatimonadaceae bacterium]
MGKLWAVIKREFLERVRTKWFIIVTIFGPIFFGVIMVLPAYLSVKGMKDVRVADIRIIDATTSGLGDQVATRLNGGPMGDAATTQVVVVAPSEVAAAESLATRDVMAKTRRGYLVVDSVTIQEQKARYAGRNASSLNELEIIQNALRSAILGQRLEREGLDPKRVEALTRVKINMSAERITDKGRGGSGIGSAIFGFLIAFLLYMMIVLYGQNILRGVLEEKTTRVAEVIVSSVSTDALLAGKVIGVGAVGLLQQAVWIGSAWGLFQFREQIFVKLGMPAMPNLPLPHVPPSLIVALVLFFILGYGLYAALFAAVGAMCSSQEDANQAAQPVVMLLVFSIIFAQPVMLNPSSRLAEIVSWIPFSAPVIMPMRMSAISIPWYELAGTLTGVALTCALCVWLSARIYRVGLLMYGKRPTMRELARWIRQS